MCRLAELLLICVISLTVKPAEGKATGRALKVEFIQNENLLDLNFWRRFLLSTSLEFLGQKLESWLFMFMSWINCARLCKMLN